jgi:Fic family protein
MLKCGYWLFEFLPISRVIRDAPAKYARAYLYTETDGGDLTYFAAYHLKVVIRAIEALHQYLAAQQRVLEEAQGLLDKYPQLNHRQRDLIWNAIKRPTNIYTVRTHEGKYRVTSNTARSDLTTLEEIGFLKKRKSPRGGKEQEYYPTQHLMKRLRQPIAQVTTEKAKKPIARTRVKTTFKKKDNTTQKELFD